MPEPKGMTLDEKAVGDACRAYNASVDVALRFYAAACPGWACDGNEASMLENVARFREDAAVQARAEGFREGVESLREAVETIEALPTFMDNHVAGITVNRYAVLSRLRALLPDSADDRARDMLAAKTPEEKHAVLVRGLPKGVEGTVRAPPKGGENQYGKAIPAGAKEAEREPGVEVPLSWLRRVAAMDPDSVAATHLLNLADGVTTMGWLTAEEAAAGAKEDDDAD